MRQGARERILDMLEAGMTVAHVAWTEKCAAAEVEAAIASSSLLLGAAGEPTPAKRGRGWSAAEDAIVDDMQRRTLQPDEIRQVLLTQGFTRPTRAVGLRMRKLAERSQAADAKRRTPR